MSDYVAPAWKTLLVQNGLGSFEEIWSFRNEWFEAPNQRRGGWSGVARLDLTAADGSAVGVFLKRQENHVYRSVRHPLRGELTFVREMKNILRFQEKGAPGVEPIYFGMRHVDGDRRAILMTEELTGFLSLETLREFFSRAGEPSLAVRRALFAALARATRAMHDARIQHGCFYAKHVMVRLRDPAGAIWKPGAGDIDPERPVEIRFIDLEKARYRPFARLAALHDLSTLNRRSPDWRLTDRLRFLLLYLGEERVGKARRFWRVLAQKAAAVAKTKGTHPAATTQ